MASPETLSYRDMQQTVIKTCSDCGYTKKLPYSNFICPSCDTGPMLFFKDLSHIVKFINLYGLGKMKIVDDDLRLKILEAFGN